MVTMVLSSHEILHFRRRYAGWELSHVYLRAGELFFVELIEELPEDTVRWSVQRAGGRAVLSRRGIHTDVPAALFEEVISARRAEVVTCLERELDKTLIDLRSVRIRAREVRAVIAMLKG
jgi:hypothetical protein